MHAVTVAGLCCLALAWPRLARAQAEALPAEPAVKSPATVAPALPAPSPADATPPAQANPTASPRRRILLMAYLGFSTPVGDGWAGFNNSPRLGALLGWQATARLSLNVECDVEYVRGEDTTEGQSSGANFWTGFWSPHRHYIDVTASPLFSLRAGQIRLGPKLGWFTSQGYDDYAGGELVPAPGSGLLFGFNAGLFVPYGPVAVGGLLTGSARVFTSASSPPGAHHTVGLLLALLF